MTSLSDLIERVEAASGPCVGLDAEIELATERWSGQHYEAWTRWQECGDSANPPLSVPVSPQRYTGSLDAGMGLVPEGFEVSIYGAVGTVKPEAQVETQEMRDRFQEPISGSGSTMALALVAASLRALQEKDIQHG